MPKLESFFRCMSPEWQVRPPDPFEVDIHPSFSFMDMDPQAKLNSDDSDWVTEEITMHEEIGPAHMLTMTHASRDMKMTITAYKHGQEKDRSLYMNLPDSDHNVLIEKGEFELAPRTWSFTIDTASRSTSLRPSAAIELDNDGSWQAFNANRLLKCESFDWPYDVRRLLLRHV